MKPSDIIGIAFSTFVHNKMRTLLTIFGVSVGIGTITFLLSLGFGLQNITITEIASSNALRTIDLISGNSSIVSLDDSALKNLSKINGVLSADPNMIISGQIGYGNSKTDTVGNLTSARYVSLNALRLETGHLYTKDTDSKILVSTAVANAFSITPQNFIGKKVTMYAYVPNPQDEKNPKLVQEKYTVVGVIKDTASSYVYLPFKTIPIPAGTVYGAAKLNTKSTSDVPAVKDAVAKMGFKATSLGDKVDQVTQFFKIVNLVLLSVGAIALFVASIGMFNTLTISLLERTRDIGIMKSLGATDREVYAIFLSESTIIATIGGSFGVGSAAFLGFIINRVIAFLAASAHGEAVTLFQVPVVFVLMILAASVSIGVLTGIYPARRAAKLNPLDALRYE